MARLVELFGGTQDEATAARIGLLVQACQPTADLIGNAVRALHRAPGGTGVANLLTETLCHEPPVRATRRVSTAPVRIGRTDVAADTLVVLDLAAANRDPAAFADPDRFDPQRPDGGRHLTFGAGLRPCPGHEHALAIAAGALTARLAAQSGTAR